MLVNSSVVVCGSDSSIVLSSSAQSSSLFGCRGVSARNALVAAPCFHSLLTLALFSFGLIYSMGSRRLDKALAASSSKLFVDLLLPPDRWVSGSLFCVFRDSHVCSFFSQCGFWFAPLPFGGIHFFCRLPAVDSITAISR
jgi:hypothetical protein